MALIIGSVITLGSGALFAYLPRAQSVTQPALVATVKKNGGLALVQAAPVPKRRRDWLRLQPRLIRFPDAAASEMSLAGRIPEILDIARPGIGARVRLISSSLIRPSSPKSCFSIQSFSIHELRSAATSKGGELQEAFTTRSFMLRVTLQPNERIGHLQHALKYRRKSKSCRVVVCDSAALVNPNRRVLCVAVTHLDAKQLSDTEILLRSSDPLFSGFPHRDFIRVDEVPADALWLIRLSGPIRKNLECNERVMLSETRCLNYCRHCDRGTRREIRRQADPYPYRFVRYALIIMYFILGGYGILLATGPLGVTASATEADGSADPSALEYTATAVGAVLAAVGLCLGFVLMLKNVRCFLSLERKFHDVLPGTLVWTATSTRCLADANYIRHGWLKHGSQAMEELVRQAE